VEAFAELLEGTVLGERVFWQYLSIPLVAAVVGYYTNWIAIYLTFHPLRFWGIPPWLGWQGIIPKKAEKMASTFIQTTMYRLGSLPELFTEMEPDVIARHVDKVLAPRLDHYSDDVLSASQGQTWETAPQMVRRQVYAHVRKRIPELVRNIVADVGHRIDELLDFEHMVVTRLKNDKPLLNRLFLDSGKAEFKLVIDCGYYFGFVFGLLQLLWWLIYPAAWTLAFAGAVHGWLTNYLALNLIFRPLRPTKVGPFTIQGLFLRRQKEVAAIWCRIVTREILTIRAMMRSMLTGPRAARAHEVIRHHLKPLVKEAVDAVGPIAQMSVGRDGIGARHLLRPVRGRALQRGPRAGGREDAGRAHDRDAPRGLPGPPAPLLQGGREDPPRPGLGRRLRRRRPPALALLPALSRGERAAAARKKKQLEKRRRSKSSIEGRSEARVGLARRRWHPKRPPAGKRGRDRPSAEAACSTRRSPPAQRLPNGPAGGPGPTPPLLWSFSSAADTTDASNSRPRAREARAERPSRRIPGRVRPQAADSGSRQPAASRSARASARRSTKSANSTSSPPRGRSAPA